MVKVTSIGHLTLATPDIERQAEHYKDVVGLGEVGRTADEIYLACPQDACSIVLRRAATAACAKLALRVPADTDLAAVEKDLKDLGITPQAASDPVPGIARALTFSGPCGLVFEVVNERPQSAVSVDKGIVPNRLGHVAFVVNDIQEAVRFLEEGLGFRISDWMGDFFAFMRCGPDHHTVNFIKGDATRMHHHAFEARDFSHIKDTCDLLGAKRIPLIWGPGRHGIGHNIFTYHYNPDQQIVEVYTELDQMSDESKGYFDPRPWHEDNPQRPKVWTPGPFTSNIWGIPTPEKFRQ